MKAAVYTKYGPADVLDIADIARPEPKAGEVRVKVNAASVTTADWRLRASAFPAATWIIGRLMFGLFAPRAPVLGSDFAGVIDAVGAGVTGFRVGDAVFGASGNGAHAEYLTIPAIGAIALKPAGLGDADAAAMPFGANAALVFLRDFARVKPGQRVLILGASGGVGVFAVQIAKHFGAHVTAVASAANADLLRDLGADAVIDYKTQDFTRTGERYDLIFSTVAKTTFRKAKRALAPQGVFLPIEFALREMLQALWTSRSKGKRVMIGISGDTAEGLRQIVELVEAGKLRAVIDSRYLLDHIADAHRRVETRHKTGAVIVDVAPGTVHRLAAE